MNSHKKMQRKNVDKSKNKTQSLKNKKNSLRSKKYLKLFIKSIKTRGLFMNYSKRLHKWLKGGRTSKRKWRHLKSKTPGRCSISLSFMYIRWQGKSSKSKLLKKRLTELQTQWITQMQIRHPKKKKKSYKARQMLWSLDFSSWIQSFSTGLRFSSLRYSKLWLYLQQPSWSPLQIREPMSS